MAVRDDQGRALLHPRRAEPEKLTHDGHVSWESRQGCLEMIGGVYKTI